jgi:hypothetical protein
MWGQHVSHTQDIMFSTVTIYHTYEPDDFCFESIVSHFRIKCHQSASSELSSIQCYYALRCTWRLLN